MRNLNLIAWTVWLEFIRRKDFYVVLILVGLFVTAASVTRLIGIDSAATARFLMSFGLTMSYFLAAVLASTMAARQMPAELDKRTIYPLLARPVSRGTVLLGKALAVTAISCGCLVLFGVLSYLPIPKSDGQSFVVLVQALGLQMIALAVLSSLAILLSLAMPPAVAALLSLACFFAGAAALNGSALALERIFGPAGQVLHRATAIIPDFSPFNQIERFVNDQSAIAPAVLLATVAYGVGLMIVLHLIATWIFNRKPI